MIGRPAVQLQQEIENLFIRQRIANAADNHEKVW
jgi:hypothetical protein